MTLWSGCFGIKWSHEYASPVLGLKQIMPNGDCACGGMGQLSWDITNRMHRQVVVQIISTGTAHCVSITAEDGSEIERIGPFDCEDKAQACYEKTIDALALLGGTKEPRRDA